MGKIGVLLINLGTPDATDYWSMRRYLKQFLSDKRVIEAKGPVWWLVFNAIILTKKPRSSGRAYDLIWNRELDESPLRTITRAQSEKLATGFADQPNIVVDWSMRYGTPSIEQGVARLTDQGCDQVLFFPLYPQYSSATTGSAMDAVFSALKSLRSQPTIRAVSPYFDHSCYIDALAESILAHHTNLTWEPEVTIASLHGLPVDFIAKGDPYQSQCETTVNLLRKKLGLKDWQLLLTYQSRSGRSEWIGPDTEETIVRMAQDGIKNLSIITPGFSSDCIETLEEIGIRAKQKFIDAGGNNCAVIPCLNDSDLSIAMLEKLVNENLFNSCKVLSEESEPFSVRPVERSFAMSN